MVIGDISLDEDELSVLKLSPKFAVLSKLDDENVETDIEVSIAKLKYEIKRQEDMALMEQVDRENLTDKKMKLEDNVDGVTETEISEAKERQIFNPISKIFDYSRRRTTDLVENSKVYLPQLVGAKEESQLEMIRNLV